MVRRHYRYFMALDEAEITTTIIALLNVFYGSIGDIRVEALMSERCSESDVERRYFNVAEVPEPDVVIMCTKRQPRRAVE
jgi:hypothetical protein